MPVALTHNLTTPNRTHDPLTTPQTVTNFDWTSPAMFALWQEAVANATAGGGVDGIFADHGDVAIGLQPGGNVPQLCNGKAPLRRCYNFTAPFADAFNAAHFTLVNETQDVLARLPGHGPVVDGPWASWFAPACEYASLRTIVERGMSGAGPFVIEAHGGGGDSCSPDASCLANFLAAAEPDVSTFVALDFEDNRASNMSIGQACDFLAAIDAKLGRPCAIYSGNRMKETIVHATADQRALLVKRHLWLCQYGPAPRLTDANGHPLPWAKCFLWQYTGDGIGLMPHAIPGIQNHMDINHYDGTDDALKAEWTA